MMYNREKFDWDTREDAETLQRVQAIRKDPVRLKKAQDCIQDSLDTSLASLGVSPSVQYSTVTNRATIGPLQRKE